MMKKAVCLSVSILALSFLTACTGARSNPDADGSQSVSAVSWSGSSDAGSASEPEAVSSPEESAPPFTEYADSFSSASSGEVSQPESEQDPDWQYAEHIYSHRGASGYEVEHTFAAYDLAIEQGSHYIEQDLVSSKEGTLYVSHDESAQRIAGVDRLYADMTDEEIRQLRTANGEGIHTLREVFERYQNSVFYVIELKTGAGQVEAFADLVRAYGMEDQVIVQCFSSEPLEQLEDIFPDMKKILLCREQEAVEYGIACDAMDIICVKSTLMTRENCDSVHESGKKFCVYWTGTEDIPGAIALGVDCYFTNYTDTALQLEKELRNRE